MYPLLFRIGTFEVRTFGLMLVVAFFAAIWLLRRRAPRYGVAPDAMADVALWAIIGGVLGARILFILQELPYYARHLDQLFSLKFEGLTSFGGLLGGGIAAVIAARRKGIPLDKMAGLAAPAFLLGHAIGRIGCFFNGCCAGFAVAASEWYAVPSADDRLLHLPAQLFDSAMNFGALALVLPLQRAGVRPLAVAGYSLILHGLARFLYEFLRAGASSTVMASVGPLRFTEAHVVAALVMLVGAGLVAARPRVPAGTPEPA